MLKHFNIIIKLNVSSHSLVYEKNTKTLEQNCALHSLSDAVFGFCVEVHMPEIRSCILESANPGVLVEGKVSFSLHMCGA